MSLPFLVLLILTAAWLPASFEAAPGLRPGPDAAAALLRPNAGLSETRVGGQNLPSENLRPAESEITRTSHRAYPFGAGIQASGPPVAPSRGGGQNLPVLHQDQVIINNYQRYYNDAWTEVVGRFNKGDIVIPQGMNWRTVLGQKVDAAARARLRNFLAREGIPEGPGTEVLVNRWLRDPSGSGRYRIPDLRLPSTNSVIDGTIGQKSLTSPQLMDFDDFSGGGRIIVVRPAVGPRP